MVVKCAFKRTPAYRIAFLSWSGPWSDKRIRTEFERVDTWARSQGYRTGVWIFREPGTRRWEVGIELKGRGGRASRPVRIKTLPAARVASVVFDPDVVSPELVYLGIPGWVRWHRKDGKVRSIGGSREVYSANPWTHPKASASTEIQYLVRP